MPELAAHARDVPVNQIREITEAAWHTPGAIILSIGEPGFALPPPHPGSRHGVP